MHVSGGWRPVEGVIQLERPAETRPPRTLRAAGPSGEIRVGYQVAASLGAWTLDVVPGGSHVSARVVAAHGYWITQGPFELTLTIGRMTWRWTDVVYREVRDGDRQQFEFDLHERPSVEDRAL